MIGDPSPDKLAGVGVGDIVFVGSYRETLRPAQVEKVGKIHIVADGKKYAIRDGILAGRPATRASMAYGHTRAHLYTDALQNLWDLHRLKNAFERELAAYRNTPGRQTAENLKAVIKALNPDATP